MCRHVPVRTAARLAAPCIWQEELLSLTAIQRHNMLMCEFTQAGVGRGCGWHVSVGILRAKKLLVRPD